MKLVYPLVHSLPALFFLTATALAVDPVVSIDFAKIDPVSPDEKAGVEEAAHWNAATEQEGSIKALVDSTGKTVAAGAEWAGGQESWVNSEIEDQPGNARMMKEYLDANPDSPTTVKLTGLSKTFAGKPYDIIIYTDGQNGSSSRVTQFQIGDKILRAKDKGNGSFRDEFEEAPPAIADDEAEFGNFVRFRNLTQDTVDLEVRAGAAQDAYPRGTICGLQIVPAQN